MLFKLPDTAERIIRPALNAKKGEGQNSGGLTKDAAVFMHECVMRGLDESERKCAYLWVKEDAGGAPIMAHWLDTPKVNGEEFWPANGKLGAGDPAADPPRPFGPGRQT